MNSTVFSDWNIGPAVKEVYRGACRPSDPENLKWRGSYIQFNSFQLNVAVGDVFSYQWSSDWGATWGAAVVGVNAPIDISLPDAVNGVKVTRTAGIGSSSLSVNDTVPSSTIVNMQRFVPATLGTVNIQPSLSPIIQAVLEPAGLLAVLTINLPIAAFDGQICNIGCTQVVTALSLGAGSGTIVGAITSFLLNGTVGYMWNTAQSKWYKIN